MAAGPQLGALGATFKVARMLQAACLIAIIGMVANFISEMVQESTTPPKVLVATLSITCIAVLYCATTFILYVDFLLPFLVSTGADAAIMIALIVVACVIGKPLSYLNCQAVGYTSSSAASTAYAFAASVESSLENSDGQIIYSNWIGVNKSTCLEMKSVWGLSIALCILFAMSSVASVCLWRATRPPPAPKDIEN